MTAQVARSVIVISQPWYGAPRQTLPEGSLIRPAILRPFLDEIVDPACASELGTSFEVLEDLVGAYQMPGRVPVDNLEPAPTKWTSLMCRRIGQC